MSDFDLDGRADLIGHNSSTLYIGSWNEEAKTFDSYPTNLSWQLGDVIRLVADFDRDGRDDLLVKRYAGALSVYRFCGFDGASASFCYGGTSPVDSERLRLRRHPASAGRPCAARSRRQRSAGSAHRLDVSEQWPGLGVSHPCLAWREQQRSRHLFADLSRQPRRTHPLRFPRCRYPEPLRRRQRRRAR